MYFVPVLCLAPGPAYRYLYLVSCISGSSYKHQVPILEKAINMVADIEALSLEELRALVKEAGMSSEDCVDKAGLRERAGEALELPAQQGRAAVQSSRQPHQ